MALTDHTPHKTRRRRSSSRSSTFSNYYEDYAARQIWSPQTARAVDLAARTFPYRDEPLRHLTHADIETWIRQMHDADLAPATIRTRVANIRAILYAATRDGLMTDNPAVGVRLPRATGRASSAAMPTANQVERLIASSPAPYNALFALCAYAGLRLGEARALRWDDIDLNRRTLAVRRQLRLTPGGGWETSPPKSESHRTIPIPPELLKMLGERPSDGQKLILEGANGTPLHPGSIHRVWTRQRASCGLPNGLRLHDLRHWFASSLIADGKNILTVQRRLGHTHASTTLDIYAHVLPEREIDVAAFGNVVAGHSR